MIQPVIELAHYIPLAFSKDLRNQARLAGILEGKRGEHPRIVGIGRLEKWEASHIDEKFALEAKYGSFGADPLEAARLAVADLACMGIRPIGRVRLSQNALTNQGLSDFNNFLIGTAGTNYSTPNALMGVGDSATAFAVTQTDMQALTGATHRRIDAIDATYPTVSNGVLTFRATIAAANGNFLWNEWVITTTAGGAVGTAALTRILNRAVVNNGTKDSSKAWQHTVTFTMA